MATATRRPKYEFTTIQLWPRGTSVAYAGQYPHYKVRDAASKRTRNATTEENNEIHANVLALCYVERDVLANQSALVSDLMQESHEGFESEDIENMYVDPSDWNIERCHEYLSGQGADEPDDNNPWKMDRFDIIEFLSKASVVDVLDDTEHAAVSAKTLEQLIADAIEAIDDETAPGLDVWRDAVRDYSQENPQEAYEWYLVSSWLCAQLRSHGEIVLDNNYGYYWGRGCTGQSMIMDGTMQQIAREFL